MELIDKIVSVVMLIIAMLAGYGGALDVSAKIVIDDEAGRNTTKGYLLLIVFITSVVSCGFAICSILGIPVWT